VFWPFAKCLARSMAKKVRIKHENDHDTTWCMILLTCSSLLLPRGPGCRACSTFTSATALCNGHCKFTWQAASSRQLRLNVDPSEKSAIAVASPPTYTLLLAEAMTDVGNWYVSPETVAARQPVDID